MDALDASFSSVTRQTFNLLYLDGYRLFIQNCWTGLITPTPALYNLRNAITEGFIPAIYIVVVNDGATPVQKAKEAVGDLWDQLDFVAIDVEVAGTTTEAIMDTLDLLPDKKICIYTAKWAWTSHMNDTHIFKSYPLWDAAYDSNPDIDPVNYGGWTEAIGTQYQGTTNLYGSDFDLNSFLDEWILGEDMNLEERVARLERIAGGYGYMGLTNEAALVKLDQSNISLAGSVVSMQGKEGAKALLQTLLELLE